MTFAKNKHQRVLGKMSYRDAQNPETGVVPQRFRGVEQERDHEHGQYQRVNIGRYVQRLAVEEYQSRTSPHQAEHGGQLHDVLFRQMVPGVQLENKHVVDAGRPPAVYVDAHEEQKYHQQQRTPVQPDHHPPVRVLISMGDSCKSNAIRGKDARQTR